MGTGAGLRRLGSRGARQQRQGEPRSSRSAEEEAMQALGCGAVQEGHGQATVRSSDSRIFMSLCWRPVLHGFGNKAQAIRDVVRLFLVMARLVVERVFVGK